MPSIDSLLEEDFPYYKRRSLWASNNHWVWKFIPGVLVGFFGCLLLLKKNSFSKGRPTSPRDGALKRNSGRSASTIRIPSGEGVKLILVVNKGLKEMKPGKMGAQCGHASAMVMKILCSSNRQLLAIWEENGQRKITVRADSLQQIEDISSRARKKGILVTPVYDAGKTQVKAGSLTVVAIGPASDSQLIGVTDHLKLLS